MSCPAPGAEKGEKSAKGAGTGERHAEGHTQTKKKKVVGEYTVVAGRTARRRSSAYKGGRQMFRHRRDVREGEAPQQALQAWLRAKRIGRRR